MYKPNTHETLYKAKDYNQAIPLALSFISQHQNHFQAHYDLYCAYDFLFKSENTNNLKKYAKDNNQNFNSDDYQIRGTFNVAQGASEKTVAYLDSSLIFLIKSKDLLTDIFLTKNNFTGDIPEFVNLDLSKSTSLINKLITKNEAELERHKKSITELIEAEQKKKSDSNKKEIKNITDFEALNVTEDSYNYSKEILLNDSNNFNANFICGKYLFNSVNYYNSLSYFLRAIKIKPSDFISYQYLGDLYLKTIDTKQHEIKIGGSALTSKQIIEISGGGSEQEKTFLSNPKPDLAIKYYQNAIKLNSNLPSVNYNLGLIYESKKDMINANKYFEKACQLDNNYCIKDLKTINADSKSFMGRRKEGQDAGLQGASEFYAASAYSLGEFKKRKTEAENSSFHFPPEIYAISNNNIAVFTKRYNECKNSSIKEFSGFYAASTYSLNEFIKRNEEGEKAGLQGASVFYAMSKYQITEFIKRNEEGEKAGLQGASVYYAMSTLKLY